MTQLAKQRYPSALIQIEFAVAWANSQVTCAIKVNKVVDLLALLFFCPKKKKNEKGKGNCNTGLDPSPIEPSTATENCREMGAVWDLYSKREKQTLP